MNDTAALPVHSSEELAGLDPVQLMALMVAEEDRVPRNLVDACASRGEAMVEALRALLDPRCRAEERSDGDWWLLLHAVMILGLIPGESAGQLLVDLMRRMAEEEDDNLQDWLAGHWPALFANKTGSAISALRALGADRSLDWYIRANVADPVIAAAERDSEIALDETLAWAAKLAADEQEDWMLRVCLGNTLLDFPREAYRPLLEDLAERQTGLGRHFTREEVRRAYAAAQDKPEWRRFKDPWVFYSPEAITGRQERWAKEDARADQRDAEDDAFEDVEATMPYFRDAPRIGRNDPCPCGSGKKYKKCCLARDQG